MKIIDSAELPVYKIIILSLAPGIVLILLVLVFSSPLIGINFNILLALMTAVIIGLIPFLLGTLKFMARRENKKIIDLLPYKNRINVKKFVLSAVIPFAIAVVAFVFIRPIEAKIWKIFDFIPDWFRLNKVNLAEINYLKITLLLTIALNGFFGPIAEEIYFRGYLLPRMGIFGKFAPLVNAVLFSVYHFFTPWQNITRIIAMTPIAYSVWMNKNFKIGIIVHCVLNICGDIPLWILLLS